MTYSEVMTFIKNDPTVMVKYKSVTTMTNESLLLSEDHLVYVMESGSNAFNPM